MVEIFVESQPSIIKLKFEISRIQIIETLIFISKNFRLGPITPKKIYWEWYKASRLLISAGNFKTFDIFI